ncbi:dystroglycan-like [Dorcoceras hygrometricum]|uniref:Dystroglycan-like n=1 Tax=Dorcoceras hygrometricum TaxID=472368 RepID=A0A2Z7AC21_9LAMI|nr:dystroglycan-like [Dorcoceras hygrometricum]
MDDPGMVSMFQAIMASGLEGFLGCPAVIYEAALVDFFENTSVRYGVIISTVAGQLVEISEEWFEESFDLPVDGLADLSEIPKNVVFDAKSIVSMSGEPVSLSGKKGQMKIEYRLLCDIMAKSISVKLGSFNAITVEKFSMLTAVVCGVRMNWASVLFNILKKMVTPGSKQAKGFAVQISLLLENIPNLELGESSEFLASKFLTEKIVHRYVSLNDKVGAEEAAAAPKPKAASKKRPTAVLGDEPVVKKKRMMKKKSRSSKVNLEIVAVAQEAVPIQMVEPTTAAPAAEDIFAQPAAEDEIPANPPADEDEIPANPPADEVADETVDEEAADEGAYEETADGDAARVDEPASEPAVADIVNEEPSTADDVDIIIEQVLADTAQIRVDEEDQIVRTSGEGNQPAGTAEERQWFDLPYDDLIARWDAERIVTTPSDTDEEIEIERAVGIADGVQTESSQLEYTVQKPEDMEMSDDERSVDELIDADEQMSLDEIILTIPAELPLPSAEREISSSCSTSLQFCSSPANIFCFEGISVCTVFIDYNLFSRLPKEDITSFFASIASEKTLLRSVQIAQNTVSVAPIVQLIDKHSSSDSTSDDISMDFADQDTAAAASISLLAAPIPDVTKALNQLRASIEQISERDDGAKHKDTLLLHLHHLEMNLTARLNAQDRVLGALRRDSNDQRNLMSMDIKSSHKQLSTQIASNALDLVDVRRVVRENHQELNAKVTSLEEKVAATRHDLLDFSAQAQQTLNVITDQLSELVAYINRGGNDKKGEVSSSRPPPDDQNRGSGYTGGGGDTVRTTDIPQKDIDNAQRNILERLMSADRARERERRSKSRSGSGSYKRRR